MPLTKHTKKIGTVDYGANQAFTLSIPRDGVLLQLLLRLQFTVTAGSSAMVGAKWITLARLFQRISVILNGRDTVVAIDGPGAVARAIYEYGVTPDGIGDTFVLTGSATVTAYDVTIPIPFYFPQSANPLAAALPADRFSQVSLEILWGSISDLVATVNSAAISLVTCSVEGEYLLDVNPARPFLARVLDMKTDTLSGTDTNFQVTIDTGTGLLYRSILVATIDDDVAVNTMLNTATGELALESGTFTFQRRDPASLQAENALRFLQSAAQTGVYYLMAEKFGNPEMLINTARDVMKADLKLVASATHVGGTNTFRVYREAVRPFKI